MEFYKKINIKISEKEILKKIKKEIMQEKIKI